MICYGAIRRATSKPFNGMQPSGLLWAGVYSPIRTAHSQSSSRFLRLKSPHEPSRRPDTAARLLHVADSPNFEIFAGPIFVTGGRLASNGITPRKRGPHQCDLQSICDVTYMSSALDARYGMQ